ncbi:MAG: hypothetical protein HP019_06220 [Ruminococcus sp.]|nr:hypothetical protein [Ruminococcus sp.]
MRIAEYKQVDTKTEEYTVTIPPEYDDVGNLISEEHEETRIREVPVMGMVYRDMTPEEIVEAEKLLADMPEPEPTEEERLNTLETTTDDIVLMLADIIGGEE